MRTPRANRPSAGPYVHDSMLASIPGAGRGRGLSARAHRRLDLPGKARGPELPWDGNDRAAQRGLVLSIFMKGALSRVMMRAQFEE